MRAVPGRLGNWFLPVISAQESRQDMTQFDRIRVGLIGYGIGKAYAAALRDATMYYPDLPPVELVAVATATEANGKRAVEESGFARFTTEYRALLASEDINAVIIATPNYMHRQMLLAALATEKAISTDKPLANNLAQAREIVVAARKKRRDAQLSFTLRYLPAIQSVRKLLQTERLGQIYSFRLAYYRASYRDPEKPLRWKARMVESGGGGVIGLVAPPPAPRVLPRWIPSRIAPPTTTPL